MKEQSTILNKHLRMLTLALQELTCQFALRLWLLPGKLKKWVTRWRAPCRAPCRLDAPFTPALAVGLLRAGAHIFCTAFKDNNEMHCVEMRHNEMHCGRLSFQQVPKWTEDGLWFSLILLSTWKMTWTHGVFLFCAGWRSVLDNLPAIWTGGPCMQEKGG